MDCKHTHTDPDCIECHKRDFVRAMTPLLVVTDTRGELPVSEVLRLAAHVAEKMEAIQSTKDVEWGVGLAAEAVFDLAHVDKNPLPTHFHVLEGDATFLPAVIAPILDVSNSDVRRLLKGGGIKVNGTQFKEVEIPTADLDRATITVGKQGVAIFCHKGLTAPE